MPARCFSRPVTHHHEGVTYGLTVWSAHKQVCIVWRRRCFYGRTDVDAWTKFLQAIDPEVEGVLMAPECPSDQMNYPPGRS